VDGRRVGAGTGRTKKAAEQQAAAEAIDALS
jgi:dsRNA-specific ribonuclease